MRLQPRGRRGRRGFTLLELMAVVVILGILASVLVASLGSADDAAKSRLTRVQLEELASIAEAFERQFGDYPPSRLPDAAGAINEVNTGIEAFVAALWSNGYEAGGNLDPDELTNTDGDSSKNSVTDFGTRELFEFVDAWNNPIAYFHNRDYEQPQLYSAFDIESGEVIDMEVTAVKNARTKRYYRGSRFQFRSAGPNGFFDDPSAIDCDDIFSFEVDRE